jgi:transcriptional regulator with XRE-family HTH domain
VFTVTKEKPAAVGIPARLRDLRKRAGLRQVDLAVRLSVSRVRVAEVERGRRGISFPEIEAWAQACGYVARLSFEVPS